MRAAYRLVTKLLSESPVCRVQLIKLNGTTTAMLILKLDGSYGATVQTRLLKVGRGCHCCWRLLLGEVSLGQVLRRLIVAWGCSQQTVQRHFLVRRMRFAQM